jgi:hypothetical protein
MKFSLRTLFVFMAIESVLFLFCVKWPVTDFRTGTIQLQTHSPPYQHSPRISFERPPDRAEMILRAVVGSAALLVALAGMAILLRLISRRVARRLASPVPDVPPPKVP